MQYRSIVLRSVQSFQERGIASRVISDK
jgi:hypothetical protein